MRYLLRNDGEYTVTVEYVHSHDTYLCEVHTGLERVAHHEFEQSTDCISFAQRFVDHHISSLYLWSLVHDSTSPPLVRPKSAAYTRECREKVARLYAGRARQEGYKPNAVPG